MAAASAAGSAGLRGRHQLSHHVQTQTQAQDRAVAAASAARAAELPAEQETDDTVSGWELSLEGDSQPTEQGGNSGPISASLSHADELPTTSERIRASSALWRRVFSVRSLFARRQRARFMSGQLRRNSSIGDLVPPAQVGIALVRASGGFEAGPV
jgi:hypothetical protein